MEREKGGDYLPQADLALLEWAKNFHEVSDEMATAWQLPKPEIATIGMLTTNFGVQLDKCHSDQATHSDFVEKNTMRKALIAKIRDFYNTNVRFNKLIDDAGRARLGVTIPDPNTTPGPVPKNYPDLTLKGVPDVICEVKLIMKNPETGRARMPHGYNGAVVASLVSDTPITDPKLLTDEELASTSHHILKFTAPQEGKRVYVSVSYENGTGKCGPPSPIQSFVIP
jgi:hypothetical protein